VLPRFAVNASGGGSLQGEIRSTSETWCNSAVNRCFLSFLAA
jgi:hypothetical protein